MPGSTIIEEGAPTALPEGCGATEGTQLEGNQESVGSVESMELFAPRCAVGQVVPVPGRHMWLKAECAAHSPAMGGFQSCPPGCKSLDGRRQGDQETGQCSLWAWSFCDSLIAFGINHRLLCGSVGLGGSPGHEDPQSPQGDPPHLRR